MSASEQDIALFDAYLREALSDEERLSFDNRLKTDTALGQEFALHKSFIDAMTLSARKELKATFEEAHAQMVTEDYTAYKAKKSVLKAFWKWIKSIMGLAMVISAVVYTYQHIKPKMKVQPNLLLKEKEGAAIQKMERQTREVSAPTEEIADTLIITTTYVTGTEAEIDELIQKEKKRIEQLHPDAEIDIVRDAQKLPASFNEKVDDTEMHDVQADTTGGK